jgi:hypothetical protein
VFNMRLLIGFLGLAAAVAAGFGLLRTGTYAWTLFFVVPMLVAAAVCIAIPRSAGAALGAMSAIAALGVLFVLGVEGAICIMLAAPLVVAGGAVGGWLATRASRPRDLAALLLLPPATLAYDATARPPLYEVRTTIEIAAPPERVWANVIAFPELPQPREWYFQAGLAYPTGVRIEGNGSGATRYCDFSTGTFVEPIEVWDPPRLLRFRVTESPAPMREWSLYGEVHPKHLHGYFISEQGEFRLTPLPGGLTRLEGTSWYRHGLWPAQYWRWWSDAIIRRIHLRVLRHIEALSTPYMHRIVQRHPRPVQ